MLFTVLGPVAIVRDARRHSLPRAQTRGVLALLALNASRPVSVDAVVDSIWGGAAPASARSQVHASIRSIRRQLAQVDRAGMVHSGSFGYRLAARPEDVDASHFHDLLQQGHQAIARGDDNGASHLLGAALALWAGEPLADAAGVFVDGARARLVEAWLTGVQDLACIRLRRGEPAAVVTELEPLVRAHPFRERLRILLMTALHLDGRSAEALQCYRNYRTELAEQEGLDPGAEIADLEGRILRADPILRPSINAPPSDNRPAPPAHVGRRETHAPALLPLSSAGFVGRMDELARLDALVEAGQTAPQTVVTTVTGTAGAGKTALALHWAHRISHRYPDGQLYIDLRGFHRTGQPMDPLEATRVFLDALGVPGERIPLLAEAQIALYRDTLAGRRILLVLDNAVDAAQVRPLLPGSPGCMVVVTSRNMLTGLAVTEGAHSLRLDLLATSEARSLLASRLGAERMAAEPKAVADVMNSCAGLPLALAIVGAHAAANPTRSVASIAEGLRLDGLGDPDESADLTAVLSYSYRALSPAAARLFVLLGSGAGPDIAQPAVASLVGLPGEQTHTLLEELVQANLLTGAAFRRYSCHDLLHAYAAERARQDLSPDETSAAQRRLFDHYLLTAHRAAMVLQPHRDQIALSFLSPDERVTPEQVVTYDEALDWFTTEHRVLVRVIEAAAMTGHDAYVAPLAWTLVTFFHRRGLWREWRHTQQFALDATIRLSHRSGQAAARAGLGSVCIQTGSYDEAVAHLQAASDLYAELDDNVAVAHAQSNLAIIADRQGRPDQALRLAERALDLYRRTGHGRGAAVALNAVGWYHRRLGHHDAALVCIEQALGALVDLGDRYGEAATLDSLGSYHFELGHYATARSVLARALTLLNELGHRQYQADTLGRLGDACEATGEQDDAETAWQQALAILEELGELGNADAERIRTKLRTTTDAP